MTTEQSTAEEAVALLKEVHDNGSIEYDGDGDYIGGCRYCGVVSYKSHEKNCLWVRIEKAIGIRPKSN